MHFEGALLKEQGLTFAMVVVKVACAQQPLGSEQY